jgi:hypothetical protein
MHLVFLHEITVEYVFFFSRKEAKALVLLRRRLEISNEKHCRMYSSFPEKKQKRWFCFAEDWR